MKTNRVSGASAEHGGSSLPTASPLSQPDGAGMDASGSYMGFRSQRNVDRDAMHARAPHTSVYTTLGSGGERVRHGSWDGSEGEGGEDRDLRDSLSTIAEERAGSETSQGVCYYIASHLVSPYHIHETYTLATIFAVGLESAAFLLE